MNKNISNFISWKTLIQLEGWFVTSHVSQTHRSLSLRCV